MRSNTDCDILIVPTGIKLKYEMILYLPEAGKL